MIKRKRKKNIKKKYKKAILFLLLLSILVVFNLFYEKWKEQKVFLIKKAREEEYLKWSREKHFCDFNTFIVQKEKDLIKKKKHIEELAHLSYEKRKKEAALASDKSLIISTSARGKPAFGYFYAFGDGFMFRQGKIASGRKNYETPIGEFGMKFKKRENMSQIYPDESGVNNMNFMIAITNSGVALHQGDENVPSHGCVHIAKKDASWLFNWVDENTKIYVTNKDKIDYKHKSLDEIIDEIKNFNQEEKKRNSIKTEKITYWSNGKIKEHWTYLGGRLEGPQYIYYSNGRLKSVWNYYHNRKNGVQKEYYPNGVKKSFINLVGGKVWEKMIWDFKGVMTYYYQKPILKY